MFDWITDVVFVDITCYLEWHDWSSLSNDFLTAFNFVLGLRQRSVSVCTERRMTCGPSLKSIAESFYKTYFYIELALYFVGCQQSGYTGNFNVHIVRVRSLDEWAWRSAPHIPLGKRLTPPTQNAINSLSI